MNRPGAAAVPTRTPRLVWLLLVIVVVVGGWLRFTHLAERGLLFFDEGCYVLSGRFLRGWWLQWMRHGYAAAQAYLAHPQQWIGLPAVFAKPAHDWLLMVAMWWGGPSLLSALRVMAMTSTLSLVGIYWVGRRLFDPWIGLMAAAICAVSSYQLIYARSALAEAGTMWWFLLAVALLLPAMSQRWPARWQSLASGVFGGIAFLSNYRLWMLLPSLWLIEYLRWRARRSVKRQTLWRRWLLLAGGFIVTVVGWLVMDWCVMRSAAAPTETYASQLLFRYLKHTKEGCSLAGWMTYPYLFALFDGRLVAIAAVVGIVGLPWQQAWGGRAVGLIALIVIGFFSVLQTHHARYIAVVLPFVALAAAWTMVEVVRWCLARWRMWRLQSAALTVVMAGLVLWRLPSAIAVTRMTTGYPRVLPTLERLAPGDQRPVMATQPYLLQVFGGRWYVAPPLPEQFRTWTRNDARFFVVDYQLAFGGFDEASARVAQQLTQRLVPVAIIANPAGASCYVEVEHIHDLAITRRRLRDPGVRTAMGAILIYDLWQLPEFASTAASAASTP